MSQQFNEVRVASSGRTTFDLSHHQVTTTDFGYLIPICYRDMVPNDDFVVKPNLFCRCAPAAFPFYGKVTCRVHNFFVPYRILFPQWHSFLNGDTNYSPPYFTVANLRNLFADDKQFNSSGSKPRGTYGRLWANLGFNPEIIVAANGLSDAKRISAFPIMAYYRIWMDYFMDSNLSDHSVADDAFRTVIDQGGNMNLHLTDWSKTRNVCFKKDYFTTAKVHPQAGQDPATTPVSLAGPDLNPALHHLTQSTGYISNNIDGNVYNRYSDDISYATPILGKFTVEELRVATSYQRYLERNNYVGTKIQNQLLVHFGIVPPAVRLDQAEYLGGSNFPVQVGDVTSTAPNFDSHDPRTIGLGAQAGKAIAASQTETIRYHAKEHGIFMSVLSVLPDTSYYQGISRFWTKGVNGDRFDYYTPEFENLGFQEVLNEEVYVPTRDISVDYQSYDPQGIFGYVPRFSEYRFQNDVLAGDFVGLLGSGSSEVMGANMDSWHLFRKLYYDDAAPLALNQNFVECNNKANDFDRVFQVTDNKLDHFYFNIECDVKATRPMVGFAEPCLDSANHEGGPKINVPYGGTRL